MLLIKSFVLICASLTTIISLSNTNFIDCEIVSSQHLLQPPRPLEVEDDDQRPTIHPPPPVAPLPPIFDIASDEEPIDLPTPIEKTKPHATEPTLLLPSSSISPVDSDDYPQITGWGSDFCDEDEVFVRSEQKCLKKSFIADDCISSEQCIVPQSTCLRNMCVCIDYFVDYSRNKCTPIHNTAIEIYKITMIFASSCLALILLIFLACILRKSYCPADSSHQGANRSTINDLFTIYPGTSGSPNELFNSLTPAEKPPSYSETMRMINQEIGTPPPAYHNIFYTETSSQSTNQPNVVQINEQSTTSSQPPQPPQPSRPANCDNGSTPASSSQSTTINAQHHTSYSSLSQHPQAAVTAPPPAPSISDPNQGKVNSAFDCDS